MDEKRTQRSNVTLLGLVKGVKRERRVPCVKSRESERNAITQPCLVSSVIKSEREYPVEKLSLYMIETHKKGVSRKRSGNSASKKRL